MKKSELAKKYFMDGYNCSQAVLLAFEDMLDLDRSSILKLSSGFGGGMGRLRLTCGAFSSLVMVIGLLEGYDTPETGSKKIELYRKIQELAEQFKKENGSLDCGILLDVKDKPISHIPTPRDEDFYKTRPCLKIIMSACDILEEYIQNK